MRMVRVVKDVLVGCEGVCGACREKKGEMKKEKEKDSGKKGCK